MLNAEHYRDPTASIAITRASAPPPRRQPFGKSFKTEVSEKPAPMAIHLGREKWVPISEMNLDEVKQQLRNCGKANGDPNVCLKCMGGCAFGTRAAELMNEKIRKSREYGSIGGQAMMRKTITAYQEALDSGDPLGYIINHSKMTGDARQMIYQAKAKLKRWEHDYGAFVKKPNLVEEVKEMANGIEEVPHLMQMPCLSKKVAAERAAQDDGDSASATQVFSSKLDDLRRQVDEIAQQIADLTKKRDDVLGRIRTIETAAGYLEIAI